MWIQFDFDSIPAELKTQKCWVSWKDDKCPVNARTGGNAQSNNPATWSDWDTAAETGRVGVILAPPYVGIDLDHVRNPETGELLPWASRLVAMVDSYTEVSPSGTGLHILCRGTIEEVYKGPVREDGSRLEIYDNHPLNLTGVRLPDTPAEISLRGATLEKVMKDLKRGDGKPKGSKPSGKRLVPLGERNDFLTKQAGKLRHMGLSGDAINFALQDINNDQCDPPLDRQEVATIAKGMERYAPASNTEPLYLPTDIGNGRRLAKAAGGNVHYVQQAKSWFVWDGKRWTKDEEETVMQYAKKTARAILHEAAEIQDSEKRKAYLRFHEQSESAPRLAAMIKMAESEPGIPVRYTNFDADRMIFNCANGTVDLATGELRPHRREDFLTKMAPVEYTESGCQRWKQFIREITNGDEGLQRFLQKAIGYSLTGRVEQPAIFILYGTGANGKSTFLETVRYILGDYAQNSDFSTFAVSKHGPAIRNDVARMAGIRLITAMEGEQGARLAESQLKSLTGGDTITARFLYGEHFEFRPQCKIWLGTNHKPNVRGTDNGFWRRVAFIPFTATFPPEKQEQGLKERLCNEEGAGILQWALEGLALWQAEGLVMPESVKTATREFRHGNDVLSHFFETRCVENPRAEISAKALYSAYKEWAQQTNEWDMPMRFFSSSIAERGFRKVKHMTGQHWIGLKLRETDGEILYPEIDIQGEAGPVLVSENAGF